MPITLRGGPNAFKREIELQVKGIENDLISIMQYVGEEFVRDARENVNIDGAFPQGDYTDRTANLRSSIGYCISRNGKVIEQNIKGTATGVSEFNEVIKSKFQNDNSYHLLLVAGMNYASYVESKGYNVITSQADAAIFSLDELFKKYENHKNAKL